MSEYRGLEYLAGKALLDEEFRERLFSDPEATARDYGVALNEYQIKNLKAIDRSRAMEWLAEVEARVGLAPSQVGHW
jgi:hypothetical protein